MVKRKYIISSLLSIIMSSYALAGIIGFGTDVNMGGNSITNLANAVNPLDAINYGQVKLLTNGFTTISVTNVVNSHILDILNGYTSSGDINLGGNDLVNVATVQGANAGDYIKITATSIEAYIDTLLVMDMDSGDNIYRYGDIGGDAQQTYLKINSGNSTFEFISGPTPTLDVNSAKITELGTATASTDAINFGQLKDHKYKVTFSPNSTNYDYTENVDVTVQVTDLDGTAISENFAVHIWTSTSAGGGAGGAPDSTAHTITYSDCTTIYTPVADMKYITTGSDGDVNVNVDTQTDGLAIYISVVIDDKIYNSGAYTGVL